MSTFTLTLINEQGKKYSFTSDKFKPGTTLSSVAGFSNGLASLGVSAPNGSVWIGSLEPKVAVPRKPRPKTAKKKRNDSQTTVKKIQNSSWLLSPSQVINWKPETVIRKLKEAFESGAKANDFITTLHMIKYVWHSDLFDFQRRVEARDFSFMLKKAYDFGQKWTKQMMESLPDLLYLFDQDYQTRIHRQWQARRNAEKKEMREFQEGCAVTTTTDEGEETSLIEAVGEEVLEKKKIKGSKKERKLLKIQQNKGKKQPKKPKWFF